MNRLIRWCRWMLIVLGTSAGLVAGGLLARPTVSEETLISEETEPLPSAADLGVATGRAQPTVISYPGLLSHSLLPPVERSTSAVPVKRVADTPPPPDPGTRVRVTGVFRCTDPRKSRVVIVRLTDGKQEIHRVGDHIEGIEILSIGEIVELRYGDRRYRARFVADASTDDGHWRIESDDAETTSQQGTQSRDDPPTRQPPAEDSPANDSPAKGPAAPGRKEAQ